MSKFYMIGNTHFDPVWEWTWDEAMASIRATFRSALDRMKEYPDFCYSFSSPPVFEWIKKTDLDMFEEIKQRVDKGRWDLAEGWWNQPDCFSAMGESYVRQGLYGQRYLMQSFGKYSECAFNTDSFGHPNMLPQILSKSGIKYYCLCRPEEHHYPLKSPLFKWKSCDGSSVLAFRIGGMAGEGWAKSTKEVFEKVDTSCGDLLVVYGVTDHGGAPTKKSIEEIIQCDDAEFSNVSGYFKKHQNPPTEIEDEFITGDFGVYCNNTAIKQLNRKAEYALLNAEKSCVIAKENHTEELTKCWHDVLFNQFHDILGGASIKKAYTDACNLYGRAIQTAEEIMHFNLQRMTAQMKMPGKNPDNVWNIVLWNLNCCEFNGYAEAEVQWAHEFEWYDKGINLEDENGNRIDTQIIAEHSAIPRFRSRFIFKACIPPMGYKAFKVIRDNTNIPEKQKDNITKIETNNFVYRISDKNGSIEGIYDKIQNKQTATNLFVPTCYEDDGDTWCFNIESYGKKKGEFTLVKAEVTESGAVMDKVKLTLKYNASIMYMYYTFYHAEDYFDVEYSVNWNEEHTVFKLSNNIDDNEITVSTPYGQMKRNKSILDKPMGEWLRTDSLVYLTGSNFAYNFYDNTLGLTVLRSPIYGDFRLGELPERDYTIMEQGITEGRIRVMIGKCNNPSNEAASFNNPPIIVCESNHDGKLPPENSYISLEADNAIISTVKYSEDNSGMILRIVDYSGADQNVVLNAFGNKYDIGLMANEIKTIKLNKSGISEVNLLEDSI